MTNHSPPLALPGPVLYLEDAVLGAGHTVALSLLQLDHLPVDCVGRQHHARPLARAGTEYDIFYHGFFSIELKKLYNHGEGPY